MMFKSRATPILNIYTKEKLNQTDIVFNVVNFD